MSSLMVGIIKDIGHDVSNVLLLDARGTRDRVISHKALLHLVFFLLNSPYNWY